MSEFMGLIYGEYDAKSGNVTATQESATVPVSTSTPNEEAAPPTKEAAGKMASSGGFQPGGASLHCCMYVSVCVYYSTTTCVCIHYF
jgi:homogentisate 1,2-dioxygenase